MSHYGSSYFASPSSSSTSRVLVDPKNFDLGDAGWSTVRGTSAPRSRPSPAGRASLSAPSPVALGGTQEIDFTKKAASSVYFEDWQNFAPVLNAYCRSKEEGEAAVDRLPPRVQWMRGLLPQLKALAGKEVTLAGGFCKLKDEVEGLPRTDKILNGIRACGVDLLFVDMRKECQRVKNGNQCVTIDRQEMEILVQATAIELQIATVSYGIRFRSAFAFSACWMDGYGELVGRVPVLQGVPYHWEKDHIGWLRGQRLRSFVESVHRDMLPPGITAGDMWTKVAASLHESSIVWPRFARDATAQFNERFNFQAGVLQPIPGPLEQPPDMNDHVLQRPLLPVPEKPRPLVHSSQLPGAQLGIQIAPKPAVVAIVADLAIVADPAPAPKRKIAEVNVADPTSEPPVKQKQRRNKPSKNCIGCGLRKTKCGRERPSCIQCAKLGRTCEYQEPKTADQ
ncbi:hypothetical protein LTR17_026973 [Elasticomyces elasticus]|nr:hypothetical protein LTR17_026973 [Elasticomyces elasticus]